MPRMIRAASSAPRGPAFGPRRLQIDGAIKMSEVRTDMVRRGLVHTRAARVYRFVPPERIHTPRQRERLVE